MVQNLPTPAYGTADVLNIFEGWGGGGALPTRGYTCEHAVVINTVSVAVL